MEYNLSSGLLPKTFALAILVIAAVLHEICHGLAAEKLGDTTARRLGRITLNPIKHIDPFMTIILPGLLVLSGSPIIFGGAKPVPVDPRYFRNPRRGMAWVAAAGPACNFLLAGIAVAAVYVMGQLGVFQAMPLSAQPIVFMAAMQWVLINLVLAIFNLFPIPPLDGGRIMTGILPLKLARPYAKLERYGLLIVIACLYFGIIDQYLMTALVFVAEGLAAILNLAA